MLNEAEALRLIEAAVERVGGPRFVVGSPRHPFALNSTDEEEVEGHTVIIHYSEISSPALAEVDGWIFEVREDEYVLMQRPRPGR
ncbi:MAG TPA: protein-L-isoaspartate o-methyltransferase 1 [Thermomicrobiales bacterium]|nr:protein-L-isoaspartate o-methyltransferase 1 [Thermomicrobiales bacterium]